MPVKDRHRLQHACPGLDGDQHLPGAESGLEVARLGFGDPEPG
jgi:hypothetical protein